MTCIVRAFPSRRTLFADVSYEDLLLDIFLHAAICHSLTDGRDTAQAGLIVVYANRGTTTRLVAKYRPPMPVVALVVPTLVQRDHKWTLRGLAAARQTLIVRGAWAPSSGRA